MSKTTNRELLNCWIIERKDGRHRIFSGDYPKLAASDHRVERVTIAFWEGVANGE